jgi:hypothetical protein
MSFEKTLRAAVAAVHVFAAGEQLPSKSSDSYASPPQAANAKTNRAVQEDIEKENPSIYSLPEMDPVSSTKQPDVHIPAPKVPDAFEPRTDEELIIPPPREHGSA